MPTTSRNKNIGFFSGLFLIACVAVAVGAEGENVLLTLFAIGIFLSGFWLLWRPGESPILLLVFVIQWLQASTKVFYGDWLGVAVDDLTPLGNVEMAITLSLIGVLALALGLRFGAGHASPVIGDSILNECKRRSPKDWFFLYMLSLTGAAVATAFAWIVPGLTQPLLAAASMKWVFYWMLTYATFAKAGSNRLYWFFGFLIELALGLGGYFADFRTVFLFTLLAMLAVPAQWSLSRYARIALIAVLMLFLSLVWTAIKEEYRDYISEGSGGQTVSVAYEPRLTKLIDLTMQLDSQKLEFAVGQLVNRISYVDFFAFIIAQVPEVTPYDNGAIWWDALVRPFNPRLLFPEKSAINDSERTNNYGLRVAGAEDATSISLGYPAETYIDFGPVFMMPVICVFGLVMGYAYRWFLFQSPFGGVLGMGMATNLLFSMMLLESSITKLVGGFFAVLLASWVTARFVVPIVAPWLNDDHRRVSPAPKSLF